MIRIVTLALVLLVARSVHAQKAEATAAFQHGQDLKRSGKLAEACAAFELSMKLDAQRGTQYNLALCYLDLGRTASAWAELQELANTDSNAARRDDAARRAHELEPKLTRVTVALTDRAPGLVVTRDGIDITALADVATPTDPGTHHFAAHAPDRRDWSRDVDVSGAGKTIEVAVPALERTTAAPAVAAPSEPPAVRPHDESPSPPPDEYHPGRTRRIVGVATFAVGVAGILVGAWEGQRALSAGDNARTLCGGDVNQCTGDTAAAQHLIEAGRSDAHISDAGLIAGGALAVGGVVLYLTAPSGVAAAPVVGAHGGGITVIGRF